MTRACSLFPNRKKLTRDGFPAPLVDSYRRLSDVHQTNARLPILISHGAIFLSDRAILLHQGEDRVLKAMPIQRLCESVQAIFIPAEVEIVNDRENVNSATRHIVGDTQLF